MSRSEIHTNTSSETFVALKAHYDHPTGRDKAKCRNHDTTFGGSPALGEG